MEAVMTASHYKLDKLTAFVDINNSKMMVLLQMLKAWILWMKNGKHLAGTHWP